MHSPEEQSESSTGPRPEAARLSAPPNTGSGDGGGWGSGDATADFLGLDQDMGGAGTSGSGVDGASFENGAALDTSNSWLLSIEGESTETAATGTQTSPGEHAATTAFAEGAIQDGTEAPFADESVELAPAAPARRSRSLIFAFAATVLLGAGGAIGWKAWQDHQVREQVVDVAANPPTKAPGPKPTKPARKPRPSPVTTTPTTTPDPAPIHEPDPVAVTTPDPTPIAPTDPATTPDADPNSTKAETPAFDFGARTSDDRVARFLETRFGIRNTGEGGSSDTPTSLELLSGRSAPNGTGGAGSGATNAGGDAAVRSTRLTSTSQHSTLRLATDADLAGVWEGSTVPLDLIDKDTRILTPQVGRVRVTIHGGELFEGRLYAVGEHQVWLDTGLGRMALVSQQIKRIRHIASPDGTPVLGADGSQKLAGLPRVRVRTPGGMLYGKIIGRDERSVTLITDGGARITIESTDIEPAPEGRSIIVKGTVGS